MRMYIAIHSGRGWGRGREIDALMAAAGVDAIGTALLRLRLLNDAKVFPQALRLLQPLVKARLKRVGLATSGEAGRRATTKGLRAWIASVCPVCRGRRYQLIPGAPVLSKTMCEHCAGSGFFLPERLTDIEKQQCTVAIGIFDRHYGSAVEKLRSRLSKLKQ